MGGGCDSDGLVLAVGWGRVRGRCAFGFGGKHSRQDSEGSGGGRHEEEAFDYGYS